MTTQTPPRRMKRSTTLCLTTAMATAGLALSACDQAADWDQGARASQEAVPAYSYRAVDECKAANEVPDEACEKGAADAVAQQASAERYEERSTCEDTYGPGNCVPRSANGQSFFGPLLTGFVIGRMLDGGGRPYYGGSGLYRDRDGQYRTGYGGSLGRDYTSGRTTVSRTSVDPSPAIKEAPPRMQTRSRVVSRSGFGGGSRSYGG